MPVWLIILIALVFGIGVFALLWWIVSRAAKNSLKEWKKEYPGAQVIYISNGANCASFPGEKVNLRGNGLLILTPDSIHFKLWAPRKSLRIPIHKIFTVDTVRKFAGRLGRVRMLHVAYETESGSLYETTWALPGAETWVDTIRELKKG